MPFKKQVGKVITKATTLPFKALDNKEHLVTSIDINVTTRSLLDKNTKYFTTLDSSLLILYRTIRPYNNVYKITFTLNTIALGIYISTLKARTF